MTWKLRDIRWRSLPVLSALYDRQTLLEEMRKL